MSEVGPVVWSQVWLPHRANGTTMAVEGGPSQFGSHVRSWRKPTLKPLGGNSRFDPARGIGGRHSRNGHFYAEAFDHENSLRSREFIISWLTPTPHATAVYALCSASPPPHASLLLRRCLSRLPLGVPLSLLIAFPSSKRWPDEKLFNRYLEMGATFSRTIVGTGERQNAEEPLPQAPVKPRRPPSACRYRGSTAQATGHIGNGGARLELREINHFDAGQGRLRHGLRLWHCVHIPYHRALLINRSVPLHTLSYKDS
jgi:hypothetical protein